MGILFAAIIFFTAALALGRWILPPSVFRPSVLVAGIAIRFVLSLLVPELFIFDDETFYHGVAIDVSESLGSIDKRWDSNPWGNVCGVLYFLFGQSTEVVRIFNSALGVLSACLLSGTVLRAGFSESFARKVLFFGALAPPLIFPSILQLKEQPIGTLILILTYSFSVYTLPALASMVFALSWLVTFRTDVGLLAAAVTGVFWCLPLVVSKLGRARFVAMAALLVMGFSVLYNADTFIEVLSESRISAIVGGEDRRGEGELQESYALYAQVVDVTDPGATKNLVIAPIHSLYSPSPFLLLREVNLSIVVQLVLIILFIYWYSPYFFLGVIDCRGNLALIYAFSLYLVVYLTAAYSILTAAPEPFRYRWPGLSLFFLFALIGTYSQLKIRRKVILLWWISVVFYGMVYLQLKAAVPD